MVVDPEKGVDPFRTDLDLENSHDCRCCQDRHVPHWCSYPSHCNSFAYHLPVFRAAAGDGEKGAGEEVERPPFLLENKVVFCEREQLAGGYSGWWGAARFTLMAELQMYLWIYILQTRFYCSNENARTLLWSVIVMLVNKNCTDGSSFCLAVWLSYFSSCLAVYFVTRVNVVCKPVVFQRRNYFWRRKQLITHGTQQNENCIFFCLEVLSILILQIA